MWGSRSIVDSVLERKQKVRGSNTVITVSGARIEIKPSSPHGSVKLYSSKEAFSFPGEHLEFRTGFLKIYYSLC